MYTYYTIASFLYISFKLFTCCTIIHLLNLYISYTTLYMFSCKSCTPVHLYTCTPWHLYTCTPVLLYTCTPVHQYTCTPVLLYSCTPVHLYTCTPVHQYTSTPVLLYSPTSIHLYSYTPVLLYSSPRTPQCGWTPPPPGSAASWRRQWGGLRDWHRYRQHCTVLQLLIYTALCTVHCAGCSKVQ